MNTKVLRDIVHTRAVIKEKLKNLKLNQLDRENILEDTFQPITKPLKQIVEKFNTSNDIPTISSTREYDLKYIPLKTDDNDDDNDENIENSYQEGKRKRKYDSNDRQKSVNETITNNRNILNLNNQINLKRSNQASTEISTKRLKTSAIKKQIKLIKRKTFNKREPPLMFTSTNNQFIQSKEPPTNEIETNAIKKKIKRSNQQNAEIPAKQMKMGAIKKQIKYIKRKLYSKCLPPLVVPDNKRKRKNLDMFENFNVLETKRTKAEHFEFPGKRKSISQLNTNKKKPKLMTENEINAKKLPLLNTLQNLMDNNLLDKVYGFNIDANGDWKYGKHVMKFHKNNFIHIGNTKWKMTPGLFQLMFHSRPQHYTKYDLAKYKKILINSNAHKRHYESGGQVKGTKAYKYKKIIKRLTNTNSNIVMTGSGLTLKTLNINKPNYIYWDNPNELVDRLRLLISSQSVGHNNHNNEIISIVEELREANIIE